MEPMLTPYVRGFYQRDILYLLWQKMEERGGTHQVFSMDDHGNNTFSMKGDLVSFVHYFESPHDPKFLYLVLAENDIAGCFWLDKVQAPVSANISTWFARKYRGKFALAALHKMVEMAFSELKLQQLRGQTPHKEAALFAKRAGFTILAELPKYATINGEAQSLYIVQLVNSNAEMVTGVQPSPKKKKRRRRHGKRHPQHHAATPVPADQPNPDTGSAPIPIDAESRPVLAASHAGSKP